MTGTYCTYPDLVSTPPNLKQIFPFVRLAKMLFLKQKYISKPERKKLAQRLGLKDSQVNIRLVIKKNFIITFFSSFYYTYQG